MKLVTSFTALFVACTASLHGQWIINEINADPDATLGDANGDGSVNTSQDEFVEIVNMTGASVDIGNWTISDGFGLRHTFTAPTVVADGQAVVVFGGGTPTGAFGGSVVTTASTGLLGLNNGGDTVTLADDLAATVVSFVYGSASSNQSLTRDPDLTGTFVNHSTAAGSGGSLFSPGTLTNGSAFGSAPALAVVLDQTVLFEDAPTASGLHTGTVFRTGDTTNPVTVNIVSSAPGVATVDATATILATESSATFDFDPAGDINGAQVVTFDFTATGYDPAAADVTVLDDETVTADVVINELLYNVTGTDSEFVELYNKSGGPLDIQGWTFKAYGGDSEGFPFGGETASVSIPTGAAVTIPDQGFYLIANSQFETIYTPITADLLAPLNMDDDSVTFALFDGGGNLVFSASATDGDGIPNIGGSEFVDGGFTSFAPDLEFGPSGTFSPAGYRYTVDGGTYAEQLEFSPQPSESATPKATNVLPPELVLTIAPGLVAEDAGTMAAVGTLTRRYLDPSSPLTVTLTENDLDDSEISIPASVMFAADETVVTFDIAALTDGILDGLQTITITATDGGATYTSSNADIDVSDVDAPIFTDLVINELDTDQVSNDTAEFIELYTSSTAEPALDGLVLVFFNGNGDESYRSIDLAGQTMPADGYFVLGYGTVANVDLDFIADLGLPNDGIIQNGPDAVALFVGTSAAIPNGTTAADAVANNTLIDVIIYDTNDADDPGLAAAFPGATQFNESENGNGTTESISRLGDGAALLVAQTPTPGVTNGMAAVPDLLISGISLLSPTTVQINFTGTPSTTYVLKSDANLQGGFVTVVPTTGGSLTTDGSGIGAVEFAFVASELYFRIEE